MVAIMSDNADELNQQIEEEMTKAYIGGLMDGSGTVVAQVRKDDDYALGYTIQTRIQLVRKKPFSIQMIDDWTAKNGIYATIRQYEEKYEFEISRLRDVSMFCEKMAPYVQDRLYEFELMSEEIIPRMKEEVHLSDEEGFVEVVELIDELREESISPIGNTKYTAEYFKDLWDL